jgi:fumarate hydratase class II
MGRVWVPADALYGAQTQRALENFTIDGPRFPRAFIRALGLIKASCAEASAELGELDPKLARAVKQAALEVADGMHDAQFPLVIYQTGSGTSTNMNANEVIAHRATQILKSPVHPNDHVNRCQSSNDVIPTAINASAAIQASRLLVPALDHLAEVLRERAHEFKALIKTGRTHLMDAMPLTLGQQIGGWATQIEDASARVSASIPALTRLAIGGTAVGTGINAPEGFAAKVCTHLSKLAGMEFTEAPDHFAAQASMDAAAALSAQMKTAATALMKVSNDLRWMNSGPIAGLGEITLPALQPGSSIMPGKINPVIPEAVMMACAQVMGNDATVSVANAMGSFELNVMLPVIAWNTLESASLLGTAARTLADKAVRGFTVNGEAITALVERNPILVTALNPVIGYEKAAEIAKRAYAEGRRVKDVAREMTDLPDEELDRLLDPGRMI